MPLESIVLVIVGTAFVCGFVAAANYAEREQNRSLRNIVIGAMMVFCIMLIVITGLMLLTAYSDSETLSGGEAPPEKVDAWIAFLIALATTCLIVALALRPVREVIARLFPRYEKAKSPDAAPPMPDVAANPDGEPLFPQMLNFYTTDSVILPRPASAAIAAPPNTQWGEQIKQAVATHGYNVYSLVHTIALMLSVYVLGVLLIEFMLSGGLEGIAEDYTAELSAWDVLLNGLPQLAIPIAGVGLGIRRTLPQTLKRLGLEMPTFEQLAVGFGIVILLFIFVVAVAVAWESAVSEETLEEQTQASEAISDSITTIWMAFLVSIMAGVGEEIAFRGALQPVFGLWPTAILFAAIHMQYMMTPAALIILGVAIGFGWLRQRYNTTVAILAHFLYDFIPLALVVAAPEEVTGWITRLF